MQKNLSQKYLISDKHVQLKDKYYDISVLFNTSMEPTVWGEQKETFNSFKYMGKNVFCEKNWDQGKYHLDKGVFSSLIFSSLKKPTNKNYELLQGKPKVKGNPETDAIDTKG